MAQLGKLEERDGVAHAPLRDVLEKPAVLVQHERFPAQEGLLRASHTSVAARKRMRQGGSPPQAGRSRSA